MNQTITSQRVLGRHERPCSVEMLEAITLGGYHRNLYNDKFPKHQKSFQIYVLCINELKVNMKSKSLQSVLYFPNYYLHQHIYYSLIFDVVQNLLITEQNCFVQLMPY